MYTVAVEKKSKPSLKKINEEEYTSSVKKTEESGSVVKTSERRSPRHNREIAHQMQTSGTGLTIFPASTRLMCESVRQLVRLKGGIGSDTLVDCETAKPAKKSAGPGPCKRPSKRRSPRHDWEIAHQKQSSGTGLTIFPA